MAKADEQEGPEETDRHFFRPPLCHFANVARAALQTQKLKVNTWTLKLKKKIPVISNSLRTHWDLEITILSEVRQTEKDKYHMISLICGI